MKRRWQRLTDDLIGKKDFFLIDASIYSFFLLIKYYINKYAKGMILDAGAGRHSLKFLISPEGIKYYSTDRYIARPDTSAVGDLNYLPFKENTFDTIFCLQVIEHTATPETIVKNLSSSLKKNGILILSAPHISYLHGEPEDYYRFTKYGLTHIVEKYGLKILEISPAGSLFGYLFSLISDVILSYVYKIPVIFSVVFFLNSILVRIISKIDFLLFKNSVMPINYIVVAERNRLG